MSRFPLPLSLRRANASRLALAFALALPISAVAHGQGAKAGDASTTRSAEKPMPTASLGDTSLMDNSGDYRRELQACREGRTGEDRATCQREARNAQADRRRGRLTTQGDLQANALGRCNAHREKVDLEACRERVLGASNLSGSVASGGLLREYVVTLPQEPATTMGASPGNPQSPATPSEEPTEQSPSTPMPEPDPDAPMEDVPQAPAVPQE